MNVQLTSGGIDVPDQSKWPGPAFGGSSDACYKLGVRLSTSKYPSRLIAMMDMVPTGSYSFYNNTGTGPYITTATLYPADYGNKFGMASFRHGKGFKCSLLYLDAHCALVNPERENFDYQNMVLKP